MINQPAISKIRELEAIIGPGARNNKYRVLFPYFGKEIDIQCHSINSPGTSMGISEVFLKGRKYQLAGDRADEGSVTLSIYNDPNLMIRRFFLQIIDGIQNFNTPITIEGGGAFSAFGNNVLGNIGSAANMVMTAFDEIRRNFSSISSVFHQINNQLATTGGSVLFNQGQDPNKLWYQTEIRIQQLDHDQRIVSETILHNAFITSVSDIEYSDEVGEISTTSLTLAYTGVSFGSENIGKILL